MIDKTDGIIPDQKINPLKDSRNNGLNVYNSKIDF
jgi:hypothetical protein